MKKFIILIFLILYGCRSYNPIAGTEKVTQTITEVVHDTIIKIEKDSSSYKALLECQNGQIAVKEILKQNPGKKVKPPKAALKDNVLTVDCEVYAQEVLAQFKIKNKTIFKEVEKPVYIERELNFFQKLQIYISRLFVFLLLLWLAYKGIKKKIKL